MSAYSDYIIYVDESGDHGLKKLDPSYPVFTLVFCIFKKHDYIHSLTPALSDLKLKYWGHNDVILHEHDIRKNMSGDWSILNNKTTRASFTNDLSQFIEKAQFQIISCVIRKDKLLQYSKPKNPYELAMLFCMERLNNWLIRQEQTNKIVQIQAEAREANFNDELELEFRRICDNAAEPIKSKTNFKKIDYNLRFLSKKSNSTGLQIADLIARPIGLNALRPEQKNRAFEIIEEKFIKQDNGDYIGRGLKIFP